MTPAETLASLLAALDDPARGGEVWDLHAPDAPLPVGGGIATPAALPREAYAAAFAADAAMAERVRPGRPRGPALPDPRPVRVDDAGEGRTIAWFAATEARTGIAVAVALGQEADGRIGWSALVPAPAPWSWAEGRMAALADHAYGLGIYPRGWLDAGWQRLHGHARPALDVLPEAAFACAGSTDCCRVDWAIEVDASFQQVLDAVDFAPTRPDLVGVQLPRTAAGKLAIKQDGAPCRFLEPDRRCAVHRVVGRQVFPPCALYPFAFALTPDGLAISTSGQCGAARAGLGPRLADRSDEIYDRVAIAQNPPIRTPIYRVAADRAVPWPAFRAAEAALQAELADAARPIAERLWRAGLVVAAAARDAAAAPPPGVTDAPARPPAVPADAPARAPEQPPDQRAAVRAFMTPWLARFGLEPIADLRAGDLPEAALLTRFLRNLHHSKVLSFHFDLATSHAAGVAIWLIVLHLRAARGGVSDADWAELGKTFMHGAGMHPYLGDDDAARQRRAMLGDPGFALWLTGYPS